MSLTPAMKDIYHRLDGLIEHGTPFEQELAAHLIHEIDDYVGRNSKWLEDSTKVSQGTPPVTST